MNRMANCPVCGSPEHPSWKAHVFVNTGDRQEVANTLKPVMANGGTYKYRDAEKRRKYQRELMQRNRALASGRAEPWNRAK